MQKHRRFTWLYPLRSLDKTKPSLNQLLKGRLLRASSVSKYLTGCNLPMLVGWSELLFLDFVFFDAC